MKHQAKTADELQEHMLGTYRTVRIALFLVGYSLPFILWWGGRILYKLDLQNSMSAYYHASHGVLRNWFVGSLCTIGILLWSYKGFTDGENRALNVAGLLAAGVALFPMPWSEPFYQAHAFPWLGFKTVHNFCAIVFFILIGCVCLFSAPATLHLIGLPGVQKRWRRCYQILGGLMFALPVGMIVCNRFAPFEGAVFWVEASGVLVFATYWLVKSIEIEITQADKEAAKGAVAVDPPEGNTFQRTFRPARVTKVAETSRSDVSPSASS